MQFARIASLLRGRVIVVAFGALLTCGAAVASPPELPQVAPSGRLPYVAVLVWHDVLPQKQFWFDTTTATLHDQLARIATGGFRVITLAALRDHLVKGSPIPTKALVLTFDDNGSGIYRYAYPMLLAHRFPATLFVHTNYVGVTTSKRHNTWRDLSTMERSGLVAVQSQTANHPPDLTKLSDADVLHEFRLSMFSLEHRLKKPVFAVVYPYDMYDDRVARLARKAGYVLGFSEDWGSAGESSSLLEIHRYSVLTRFDQALSDVASHG